MCAETAHHRHRVERFLVQSIVVTLEKIEDMTRSSESYELIQFVHQEDDNLSDLKKTSKVVIIGRFSLKKSLKAMCDLCLTRCCVIICFVMPSQDINYSDSVGTVVLVAVLSLLLGN